MQRHLAWRRFAGKNRLYGGLAGRQWTPAGITNP
jgi:hypothetical protein